MARRKLKKQMRNEINAAEVELVIFDLSCLSLIVIPLTRTPFLRFANEL